MHQQRWPERWTYSEMRPPRGAPSPQQRHGIRKVWHAPTTQDFLRTMRWRARFGDCYGIVGIIERADILVPAVDGDERLIVLFTYPVLGFRALRESGLLPMERLSAIPDYDAGHLDEEYWGDDPEFWRLMVPGVAAAEDATEG